MNPDASTSWADILDVLESAGLKFSRVDPHEWVELLASSDQDGARNPAIKLLVSLSSDVHTIQWPY